MDGGHTGARISTYFAPPERAPLEQVKESRTVFLAEPTASAMLESIPDAAFVLNRERQIVASNRQALRLCRVDDEADDWPARELLRTLGLRPGEAMRCRHAHEGPGGCGTARACRHCGATRVVVGCLETSEPTTQECRIQATGSAFDLRVVATPLTVGDQHYVVTALRDISAEKRRRVLESVFFHDVLNTATAVQGLGNLLAEEALGPEVAGQIEQDLRRLTRNMVDEIRAQRDLLAAESGDLDVQRTPLALDELLSDLQAAYQHAGRQRVLRLLDPPPQATLHSDPVLLRRVIGNLIKNALEATPPGGEVTLAARLEPTDRLEPGLGERIVFEVHNEAVMSEAVACQVFQRSFSTKGGRGRGIGTYSAWLLTHRYLGGEVTFESQRGHGTTFFVRIPVGSLEPAAAPN